jgi:hypothetical protein
MQSDEERRTCGGKAEELQVMRVAKNYSGKVFGQNFCIGVGRAFVVWA